MKDDDMLLSAFLDNELDESERQSLEARLEGEPELQARLALLKSNDAMLKRTFDHINDDPVPEALQKLLEGNLEEPQSQVAARPWNFARYWQTAAAASVLVAIGSLIGYQLPGSSQSGEAQAMMLSDEIVHFLEQAPSGDLETLDAQQVLAELTFERTDGVLCRQYSVVNTEQGYRAIACQEETQWANVLITTIDVQRSDDGHYQPASADGADPVNYYIGQNIQGVPFDRLEEEEKLNLVDPAN